MAEPILEITDLHITAEDGTEILNGVTLLINEGETHALMGPNGCGKSTLASTPLRFTRICRNQRHYKVQGSGHYRTRLI